MTAGTTVAAIPDRASAASTTEPPAPLRSEPVRSGRKEGGGGGAVQASAASALFLAGSAIVSPVGLPKITLQNELTILDRGCTRGGAHGSVERASRHIRVRLV